MILNKLAGIAKAPSSKARIIKMSESIREGGGVAWKALCFSCRLKPGCMLHRHLTRQAVSCGFQKKSLLNDDGIAARLISTFRKDRCN